MLYQGVVPGQEPPGPVVGVLTAGLHVEVIEAPVLQLLAEVLNTNLDNGGERVDQLGYLKTFVLFVLDVKYKIENVIKCQSLRRKISLNNNKIESSLQ